MARRATLIDSLRVQNENCLIVDAGDFSSITGTVGPPKSAFLYKMMGRLGYDAIAFGERELKFGHGHFTDANTDGPPVIMTNVTHKQDGIRMPPEETIMIKEIGNVRIGLFSLLDLAMMKTVSDVVPEYDLDDPFEKAEEVLARFNEMNVDVTVLLSQLERANTDSLLKAFPQIDVAVIGNRKAYKRVKDDDHPAVVVHPGRRGQMLTQCKFLVDPAGNIIEPETTDHVVADEIVPDPAILSLVNEVKSEIDKAQREERLARQLEHQRRQQTDRFLGSEVCARCHEPEHETWTDGPHAGAFESLVALGMDASPECLECHTVGFGENTGYENPKVKPDLSGVQCESCHSMGSQHNMARDDREKVGVEACVGCHDEDNSPDFEFASYMAKIKHW